MINKMCLVLPRHTSGSTTRVNIRPCTRLIADSIQGAFPHRLVIAFKNKTVGAIQIEHKDSHNLKNDFIKDLW
jgi:hypothetical protein